MGSFTFIKAVVSLKEDEKVLMNGDWDTSMRDMQRGAV